MILKIHIDGAPSYDIGDEIWQQSLMDAIREEADNIVDYAGPELLTVAAQGQRAALGELIVAKMTTALVRAGDWYRAPDGVAYSLIDCHLHGRTDAGNVDRVMSAEPVIEEVVRFEDLPIGSSRHTPRRGSLERWHRKRGAEVVRRRAVIPSRRRRAALKRAERGECRVMSMFMTPTLDWLDVRRSRHGA